MNMTRINYVVCMYVCNHNCFPKILLKARRPPGGHVHRKRGSIKERYKIDTLLLHTTNSKYHMAYLFMPFAMTLDDLEGHSPNAGLI